MPSRVQSCRLNSTGLLKNVMYAYKVYDNCTYYLYCRELYIYIHVYMAFDGTRGTEFFSWRSHNTIRFDDIVPVASHSFRSTTKIVHWRCFCTLVASLRTPVTWGQRLTKNGGPVQCIVPCTGSIKCMERCRRFHLLPSYVAYSVPFRVSSISGPTYL